MLYEVVQGGLLEAEAKHTSDVNTMKLQISKLESEKEKLIKSNKSLCMELNDVTEKSKSLEENILQAQV